ncbi:MAG: helix-turn-helix transcriptional regulator [Cytophagaceae bacterium]|nr:helix-turn-helix transcriptional regulator [Cytophagaceae bacterium]
MTTLGTKIRKLRELKNLKQEDMADKLGISVTAYGKMERDETDISMERLDQIAKALDLSVQDILAFDEKVLFNFLSTASQCGYNYSINNYGINDNERKLYEDNINLLKDKILSLEKALESLNQENEKLKSNSK